MIRDMFFGKRVSACCGSGYYVRGNPSENKYEYVCLTCFKPCRTEIEQKKKEIKNECTA